MILYACWNWSFIFFLKLFWIEISEWEKVFHWEKLSLWLEFEVKKDLKYTKIPLI